MKTKHEPIIWNYSNGTYEEFLGLALDLNMDYLIYVQDEDGNPDSIWATTAEDLLDCIITYSISGYYGSVDPLVGTLGIDLNDPTMLN